jgi:hypothetical protein
MLDTITSARTAMEGLAASFEPCTLTHDQAVQLVDELGVIHRLVGGLVAKAAKRVADTAGCRTGAGRDAALLYARAVGVDASEARRVIATTNDARSFDGRSGARSPARSGSCAMPERAVRDVQTIRRATRWVVAPGASA